MPLSKWRQKLQNKVPNYFRVGYFNYNKWAFSSVQWSQQYSHQCIVPFNDIPVFSDYELLYFYFPYFKQYITLISLSVVDTYQMLLPVSFCVLPHTTYSRVLTLLLLNIAIASVSWLLMFSKNSHGILLLNVICMANTRRLKWCFKSSYVKHKTQRQNQNTRMDFFFRRQAWWRPGTPRLALSTITTSVSSSSVHSSVGSS